MTDQRGTLDGAEWFGDYAGYLPNMTNPIHVKLFGGMSVQDAAELRNQLTRAIDRALDAP